MSSDPVTETELPDSIVRALQRERSRLVSKLEQSTADKADYLASFESEEMNESLLIMSIKDIDSVVPRA